MSKILVMVLLLVMAGVQGEAGVYKCIRPDGSVVFTDNPTQSSSDCRMEKVEDIPPLGVLPDSYQLQPQAPGTPGRAGAQPRGGGPTPYDAFKGEAQQLVDEFNSARHRAFASALAANKMKARQELGDIKARKAELQQAIEQSALSSSEKQTLRDLLAPLGE